MRLSVEIGKDAGLARVQNQGMFAISPDGARLAVSFQGADGKARLGTRLLNQSQITPLPGTDDAFNPFFSPDGQWIGFFAKGKLKKIAVEGGAAVTICESASVRGASWGDDGNIVFTPTQGSALLRVSSDGGTAAPVTKLKEGELTHRWPQVLPGSQAMLFTSHTTAGSYDDASIEVMLFKTGERRTLRRGGFSPRYLPSLGSASGHLVYLHESTLFAAPFDLKSLNLTGAPVPILEDASSTLTSGGDFDFARTGLFVYLAGGASSAGWLMHWMDSSGTHQPIQPSSARYFQPRFSPDGKRLAYGLGSGQGSDIWARDLQRDTPSRLTFLGGLNGHPVWTPDGRAIVFRSADPGKPGLYWIRSDGSGEAVRLTDGKSSDYPYSVSPDGKRLAFHRLVSNGTTGIYTAILEGDAAHPQLGKPEQFLTTQFVEAYPVFSPDGRWLAYASNESGAMEVYVRPFPGPGGRWQISTGGGAFPKWSRDGRELFFAKSDGSLIVASVSVKGDAFSSGVPRVWTPARIIQQGVSPSYDLAPDGKRIIALLADEAEGQKPMTHLTFLLNFFDELKRKTGKN